MALPIPNDPNVLAAHHLRRLQRQLSDASHDLSQPKLKPSPKAVREGQAILTAMTAMTDQLLRALDTPEKK